MCVAEKRVQLRAEADAAPLGAPRWSVTPWRGSTGGQRVAARRKILRPAS